MYTSCGGQPQHKLFRGIRLKLTERTGAPQEINLGMEKWEGWRAKPMYTACVYSEMNQKSPATDAHFLLSCTYMKHSDLRKPDA